MTAPAAEGIAAAIKEAVSSSKYDAGDPFWDDGEQETEAEVVAEGTEEASSTVEATETVAAAEGEEATAEAPTEYWGVDLSDIPAEKRAEVIAHFEQQDSTIHKLQEKLSAPLEVEQSTTSEEEEDVDVTDEDLLRAAGYDPEDYKTQELAPFMLPLLRTQLATEEKLDQMYRNEQVRTVETQWNGQLDELESQYGKLPGNRLQVLNEAALKGYATPFEAYFRITAPVRKDVETAVSTARREALKREQGASLKPNSGGGEGGPLKKGISLRDAVAESMKQSQKETGLSWREAVKGRFSRTEE